MILFVIRPVDKWTVVILFVILGIALERDVGLIRPRMLTGRLSPLFTFLLLASEHLELVYDDLGCVLLVTILVVPASRELFSR